MDPRADRAEQRPHPGAIRGPPGAAIDQMTFCEVFATEVVDRSGWGGLYRVHRRRRWRRGGPDGPL